MQQGNTRRQLLSRSAAIFAIRALPAAGILLSAILLSRALSPADYGAYQAYWSLMLLCASLACIGLPSLLITLPLKEAAKFIPDNPLVRIAIAAAITITAAVFWMAGYPLSSPLAGFLILSGTALYAITEALLLSAEKTLPLVWINATYSALFIMVHLLLIKGHISFRALFTSIALITLIRLGAALALLPRRDDTTLGTAESAKKHFGLWGHLALYDATQYIFKWVDKIILSLLLPPAVFAVYFNGTYDVPFLPLLLGAAGSTILMHLSKGTASDREKAALQSRAATLMSGIVFPIFFFLVFFRREIFTVIFTSKYTEASALFLIAILVLPLRAYNFTTLLQHAGKGRTINTGAILDLLLAVLLMWPLYLLWGLRGVALAFVISTYAQAAYYLVATGRMLQIPVYRLFPALPLALRLIVFGCSYMLLYYLLSHYFEPRAGLILGAAATCGIAAVPIIRERLRK